MTREIKQMNVFVVDGIVFDTEEQAQSYVEQEEKKDDLLAYLDEVNWLSQNEMIERVTNLNIQLTDRSLKKEYGYNGYKQYIKTITDLSDDHIEQLKKSILLSLLRDHQPKNVVQEFVSENGDYHYSKVVSVDDIQSLFFSRDELRLTLMNFNNLTPDQLLDLFNGVEKHFTQFNSSKLEVEKTKKFIFYKNVNNQVVFKFNRKSNRFYLSKKMHVEDFVGVMNLFSNFLNDLYCIISRSID